MSHLGGYDWRLCAIRVLSLESDFLSGVLRNNIQPENEVEYRVGLMKRYEELKPLVIQHFPNFISSFERSKDINLQRVRELEKELELSENCF